MSNQEQNKNIADKVLDQLESKQVKMKPKFYFVTGSIVLGIGLGSSLLTSLYFIGLSTFKFRAQAPFDFLSLGTGGVRPFLATVPWLAMFVAVVGVTVGMLLIRKYRFGYRHSLKGLTIGVVGIVIVAGMALQIAGAHRLVEKIPAIKGLYHEQFEGDKWLTGSVTVVDGDVLTIVTPYNDQAIILLRADTHIQPPRTILVGEWLRAVGEWDEDTLEAEHVLHGSGERFRPKVKGELHRRPVPLHIK
jgi:hypothetical protein